MVSMYFQYLKSVIGNWLIISNLNVHAYNRRSSKDASTVNVKLVRLMLNWFEILIIETYSIRTTFQN